MLPVKSYSIQFFSSDIDRKKFNVAIRLTDGIARTLPLLTEVLAVADNRFTQLRSVSTRHHSVGTVRFLTELHHAMVGIRNAKFSFIYRDDLNKLYKILECMTYFRKNCDKFSSPTCTEYEVPEYYQTVLIYALEGRISHSPYDTDRYITSIRLNYQIARLEKWKQVYKEDSPHYDVLEAMARGQIRTFLPERLLVGAALDLLTDDWSVVSRRLKRAGIHPSWKFLHLVMDCYAVPNDIGSVRVMLNIALPLDNACAEFNAYLAHRPALSKLLLDFVRTDSILPTMDYDDWYHGIRKGQVCGNV